MDKPAHDNIESDLSRDPKQKSFDREEQKQFSNVDKQKYCDNEETFSEPSDFNDSDHIQQTEIEQILKSNSKCLLEHQLWINSTKLKKWRHIERTHKAVDEQRFISRWKIAIYGKFVNELERKLRKIAQGNDQRVGLSFLQKPIFGQLEGQRIP